MSQFSHFSTINKIVGSSFVILATVGFGLSMINASAQTTQLYSLTDWEFSPSQGVTAPLFRSQDSINVKLKSFIASTDLNPGNSVYKCKFEARAFQPRTGTAAWIVIGDGIDYNSTTGCSTQFTKAQRGNSLNWSTRGTITKTSDTTKTYTFYNSYVYRFQGAGVASGS